MTEALHEECGVFAVYNRGELDSAHMGYLALQALQHRGQDGAGMVASNGGPTAAVVRDLGLVTDVFEPDMLHELSGKRLLLGHVRYATTGCVSLLNTQPLLTRYEDGFLALAHNGNLVNGSALSRSLRDAGVLLQTDMDTEVLAHLIARNPAARMEDKLAAMIPLVYGSYAIGIMTRHAIYGMRDPWGIRPLCIGKLGETYMLASESCALDLLGAEFVRDVKPGEIVTLDADGLHSRQCEPHPDSGTCLFEYVYFARPDSNIDGVSVYEARLNAGRMLARIAPVEADIVAGVPDSAIAAAQGYSLESGIPYGDVLVKNRYIGRTFIQPKQQSREFAVKLKMSVLKKRVEGKRILLVDDSIVRGTTSIILMKMLREAGAKEIHMRISSPPVKFPCHFGINTPTQRLLINASKSVDEVRQKLGLDSLAYLSLDMLKEVVSGVDKGYCSACFDGNYPMPLHKCRRIGRIDSKI